ncbi:MAG: 30S ribosomal protein S5 [Patescibacteria group bacterium]
MDDEKEIKKDLPAATDIPAAQAGGIIAEAQAVVADVVSEATKDVVSAVEAVVEAVIPTPIEKGERPPRDDRFKKGGKRSPRGGRRPQYDRVKPEFDQKLIDIRRVARVVAGGRRFSFSVAMVIGDRKGSVGVGIGKAGDTSLAIDKAMKNSKKNLIKIRLNKKFSIPHDVYAKYSSAKVFIFPNHGKGLVAGSSVRNVLDLAGVRDVSAKVFSGSKNKLNNARAAIEALLDVGDKRPVR